MIKATSKGGKVVVEVKGDLPVILADTVSIINAVVTIISRGDLAIPFLLESIRDSIDQEIKAPPHDLGDIIYVDTDALYKQLKEDVDDE